MLETLITILKWNISSPEIYFEDDPDSMFYGDINLEWFDPMCSVSIDKDGNINWADGGSEQHGNDFERLKIILENRK